MLLEAKVQWSLKLTFIPQPILRQVHSFLQIRFSTECDLTLRLSTPSILYFFNVIQWLLTYSSSPSRHCYLSFNIVFHLTVPKPNMSNLFSVLSFYALIGSVQGTLLHFFRIAMFSLRLCRLNPKQRRCGDETLRVLKVMFQPGRSCRSRG